MDPVAASGDQHDGYEPRDDCQRLTAELADARQRECVLEACWQILQPAVHVYVHAAQRTRRKFSEIQGKISRRENVAKVDKRSVKLNGRLAIPLRGPRDRTHCCCRLSCLEHRVSQPGNGHL